VGTEVADVGGLLQIGDDFAFALEATQSSRSAGSASRKALGVIAADVDRPIGGDLAAAPAER